MLYRKENTILIKTDAYSDRILKLYQYLTEVKHEYVLSKQILRSGTSIGANSAESRNAQGTRDFVNKLSIYESMHKDNDEIVKILTKIIKTTKEKIGTDG